MTHSAILAKLEILLAKGITTEADALYLMVEDRKLLEQQQAKKQYEYLTFHCDWAVHPTLAGPTAQKILKQFDAANIHLKNGIELHDLPGVLRMKIDRISKMRYFEDELEGFLKANGLPVLENSRSDGWIHFVHLYARIVEDCPLVMTAKNQSSTIAYCQRDTQDGSATGIQTGWRRYLVQTAVDCPGQERIVRRDLHSQLFFSQSHWQTFRNRAR